MSARDRRPRLGRRQERAEPGANPERDVEEHVQPEHAHEGIALREPRTAEPPVRRRDRPHASGGEHPSRTDADASITRAPRRNPGSGVPSPAEPAAERPRRRPRGRASCAARRGEPLGVGLLDRVADLGEAGGAGDREPDPSASRTAAATPRRAASPSGRRSRGSSGHSRSARARHSQEPAARPRRARAGDRVEHVVVPGAGDDGRDERGVGVRGRLHDRDSVARRSRRR